jgi:hypothetical protein
MCCGKNKKPRGTSRKISPKIPPKTPEPQSEPQKVEPPKKS